MQSKTGSNCLHEKKAVTACRLCTPAVTYVTFSLATEWKYIYCGVMSYKYFVFAAATDENKCVFVFCIYSIWYSSCIVQINN